MTNKVSFHPSGLPGNSLTAPQAWSSHIYRAMRSMAPGEDFEEKSISLHAQDRETAPAISSQVLILHCSDEQDVVIALI